MGRIKFQRHVKAGPLSQASPAYVGPLDLVPGAVVAYSLRALSAAWRGQNVARLRRSSDNATMDFAADAVTGDFPSAAAIAWRDAAGAADAYVVTRYDQSGNGKDETQATAGVQPLVVFNATNGKPVIYYKAGGDDRRLSTSADINYTDAMTTFFVGKADSGAVGNICGGGDVNGGDHGFQVANDIATQTGSPTAGYLGSMIFSDEYNEIASCATTNDPQATIESYFAVGMTVSDSADGTVRLNGTLQAVTNERTAITPFSDRFTSGDCDPAGYAAFEGHEAESLLYGSVVSSENIQAVNADQMTFYGIS